MLGAEGLPTADASLIQLHAFRSHSLAANALHWQDVGSAHVDGRHGDGHAIEAGVDRDRSEAAGRLRSDGWASEAEEGSPCADAADWQLRVDAPFRPQPGYCSLASCSDDGSICVYSLDAAQADAQTSSRPDAPAAGVSVEEAGSQADGWRACRRLDLGHGALMALAWSRGEAHLLAVACSDNSVVVCGHSCTHPAVAWTQSIQR
jgi:hypothetical protein